MKKYLKPVTMDECDLIFEWANDCEVRKNAFNPNKISYDNHLKWFKNVMKSKNIYIFVLIENNLPIGQIRVEHIGDKMEIDYSIDLEYRGQGNGKIILKLFQAEIKKMKLEGCKLVGKVKYSNIPSQKAFEKNNYVKEEKDNYIEYVKVIY